MLRKADMSLYEINPEFLHLLNKESYTDEDLHQIDLLSNNEKEKAITLASYIRNITVELSGVADALKGMKARRDRLTKKIDDLSRMVLDKMNAINSKVINDNPNFEIRIYDNPPKVDIYNESLVPESYWKITGSQVVSLEKIKNDIMMEGIEVPGARIVQDKRLSIK